MAPFAQASPVGGGLLALVVTFLITAAFYAVTLHLAAVFFVGDVPSQRAATVGPVLAAVSMLLQRWGPAVVVPVSLAVDAVAIAAVYELDRRSTAVLVALHLAFATALGLSLLSLFARLGLA